MPDRATQILLVEDNPSDIELTMHALKKNHLANQIEVVRDGAEALDYLFGAEATPVPRLILLDLKLPKVDGLEVLQKIKADPRTQSSPSWCSPPRAKIVTSSSATNWESTVTLSSPWTSGSSPKPYVVSGCTGYC